MMYTVTMETNDVERLKAEIRYLRSCLLEAYNAVPSLPCTSLESWHVVSPIMRAMRKYQSSFDLEFLPSKVKIKRRAIATHLSRPVTEAEIIKGKPSAMSVNPDNCTKFTPEKTHTNVITDKKVLGIAKSLGVSFSDA